AQLPRRALAVDAHAGVPAASAHGEHPPGATLRQSSPSAGPEGSPIDCARSREIARNDAGRAALASRPTHGCAVRGTSGSLRGRFRVPRRVPAAFFRLADWLFEPRLSRFDRALTVAATALVALPLGAVLAGLLLAQVRS